MQDSAQGSYTIEQQNNILLIDAKGAFDDIFFIKNSHFFAFFS